MRKLIYYLKKISPKNKALVLGIIQNSRKHLCEQFKVENFFRNREKDEG